MTGLGKTVRCWSSSLIAVLLLLYPAAFAQQTQLEKASDFYGLYYSVANIRENPKIALVLSPDGRPIPPKQNDPDAPTLPGFYVGVQRFPFSWSHVSTNGGTFRTVRLDGTEYSFRGVFGREQVDILSGVPYLEGTLTEKQNGRVVLKKKVHFGHAVVL